MSIRVQALLEMPTDKKERKALMELLSEYAINYQRVENGHDEKPPKKYRSGFKKGGRFQSTHKKIAIKDSPLLVVAVKGIEALLKDYNSLERKELTAALGALLKKEGFAASSAPAAITQLTRRNYLRRLEDNA